MSIESYSPEAEIFTDSGGEDPASDFGDDLELNHFDGLTFSSRYYKLLEERKSLSVWRIRNQFEDALQNNQLVIVSGVAQTGRSTEIPQWCAEFCLSAQFQHGMVVCTQTNKQQAVDLVLRVADEMDVNIGHEVGYTIPLETCCSSDTVLREMMSDPLLEQYGVIIIDQAHERTASTDILLGFLKNILLQRPELRVVVLTMSHVVEKLLGHYGSVPLLNLEACGSPEVVYYNISSKDYFSSAIALIQEIHRTKESGDVAVFFTSEEVRISEGPRSVEELDQIRPVILCQSQQGLRPLLTQQVGGMNSRRVFLLTQQQEDLCWTEQSVNFVIDTGVQTKMVQQYTPSCFLQPASQSHRKFQHPEGDHFTLINIYNDYFLDYSALMIADTIRLELTGTLNRIELPISEPSFGTKTNTDNIKRALLAGFFMQVARDMDGSGNYLILTHKHVAQLHPFSSYGAQSHKLGVPQWVLFNEYAPSEHNSIKTVSEISPQK
uniref:DEAH (Asp-Glu-Ala-His) box polypeptide 32a n=1 Tax=Cyprinodon variegatus TaxID=28743 RepID=A0A3Q2FKT4_CYPVA